MKRGLSETLRVLRLMYNYLQKVGTGLTFLHSCHLVYKCVEQYEHVKRNLYDDIGLKLFFFRIIIKAQNNSVELHEAPEYGK